MTIGHHLSMRGLVAECVLASLLAGLPIALRAQSAARAEYHSVFDNPRVHVFRLDLPAHGSTAIYLRHHDQVWVGLDDHELVFAQKNQPPQTVLFLPASTRFLTHGEAASVSNQSSTDCHVAVVELKDRSATSAACDCESAAAAIVCGCREAGQMPRLWAVAIGGITLAGTALAPGQAFDNVTRRADMLLIAASPIALVEAVAPGSEVAGNAAHRWDLRPGEVAWISAGDHRLRNVGAATAQFVTIEF